MKIYFVRHGQSTSNLNKTMAGHLNCKLTEKGIEQAKKTGELLKDYKIDIAFCSPLDRAIKTFEEINNGRIDKIPLQIKEELIEVDYGIYEGVKKSNFDYNSFWDYTDKNNMNHFYSFAWPLMKFLYGDLIKNYRDKNILIVAHGGVSKVLELVLGEFSLYPKNIGTYLPNNSEVIEYSVDEDKNTCYFHNEKSIDDKSSDKLIRIITPNIIFKENDRLGKKLNGKIFTLEVDDKPKIRNRLGIIVEREDKKIAIASFENVYETKLLGGDIDYIAGIEKSIDNILDERFGISVDSKNYKNLGTTIELIPHNIKSNICITSSVKVKFNKIIHEPTPSKKEIEEGFILEWLDIDEAIEKMEKSFVRVQELDVSEENIFWRPLLNKQGIIYRDIEILKFYKEH